jgi:hypothetical protein
MIKRSLLFTLISILFVHFTALSQKEIADRKLSDFNSVQITGQVTAFLIPGDENKIHIEAEDVEVEKISTEVKENELRVKLLSHLFKDPTVYIEITYKNISEITAIADAEINFAQPVIQTDFKIKSTSGANIELQTDTRELSLEAFQGGQVVIKGETDSLDAYVNTGGILSGTDLICKRAEVKMNTGGKAEITVEQMLEASVNTGASFSYFGQPTIKDVSSSLGGTISAWDEGKKQKEKD